MKVTYFHHRAEGLLGFIPSFLSESDPRPAAEQFNERYAHGGGWSPMKGWTTERFDGPNGSHSLSIRYPGDPPYRPIARIQLRDEHIWIYQNAWVAIEQADGAVEIARMD